MQMVVNFKCLHPGKESSHLLVHDILRYWQSIAQEEGTVCSQILDFSRGRGRILGDDTCLEFSLYPNSYLLHRTET